MREDDIQNLLEIAKNLNEKAKSMTKSEAIELLNRAGIVTKKGEFTRNYKELKANSLQ
jgi:hypothetical protein